MEKSKLEKYREERARHLEKIADLQKRVRALGTCKSGYGRWTSASWKTKAWRFAP